MRVCIITTKYNFKTSGGSVGDIDLRARVLTSLGHKVTVVSAFSKFNSDLPEFPYRFLADEIGSAGLLGIQIGIYRLLKKYEYEVDIFHVDGQVFLYGAGLYRLLGGKAKVLGFFNHWPNAWADETVGVTQRIIPMLRPIKAIKKRVRFFLERWFGVPLANYMDVIIYNTPPLAAKFMSFGFKKGDILPDFVDTEGLRKQEDMDVEKILSRQNPSGGIITLLCAGRMLPEKGFDMVVRAFAQIPHKEKYRVILSGTGPEFNSLKKLISDTHLEAFFQMPGWVERKTLLGFFRKAQVFIFPNWWPEYGAIVLEEAMSFGLASIIPSGGALEWLSGGTARTFKNSSVDDLARVIQTLGDNVGLRITTAQNGFKHSASLDYRILGVRLEKILQSSVA